MGQQVHAYSQRYPDTPDNKSATSESPSGPRRLSAPPAAPPSPACKSYRDASSLLFSIFKHYLLTAARKLLKEGEMTAIRPRPSRPANGLQMQQSSNDNIHAVPQR